MGATEEDQRAGSGGRREGGVRLVGEVELTFRHGLWRSDGKEWPKTDLQRLNSSLQCGPSEPPFTASAKSKLRPIHGSRTNGTLAHAVLAEAAFPRLCRSLVTATQCKSPKQSFQGFDLARTVIKLLPQYDPSDRMRNDSALTADPNGSTSVLLASPFTNNIPH